MSLPKIICIVGPTASGKTALGIEIAKHVGGEVISVDSRMVYRGMDIGTAKPEGEWRAAPIEVGGSINQLFGARQSFWVEDVPHWGIDLVDPDESYSVAQFKQYAEEMIGAIVKRGNVPILVGGTGLWVSAVVDNLSLEAPAVDRVLRDALEQRSLEELVEEYRVLDPVGAEKIDLKNRRRVVRALEVTKQTGVPFSAQQTRGESPYDVLFLGMKVSREVLAERIQMRVDEMIALGLVNEVRALRDRYGCDIESMTGIGYRQICAFLSGEVSLAKAIEQLVQDTKQYAKRQVTWFKRDERICWVEDGGEAIKLVNEFIQNP